MKKIYHLDTCNTCQRIMRTLKVDDSFEVQNVKTHPITPDQLDALKERAGSYEALFNRRSRQYRGMGLHERDLSERDYRDLIIREYTFLKRPVVVVDDQVFAGNAKDTVSMASRALSRRQEA